MATLRSHTHGWQPPHQGPEENNGPGVAGELEATGDVWKPKRPSPKARR